ncbi:uroporphyrinogen-III synthase [Cohaesibacter sp. ES.047]|uniref:uroporphyrinogen-III synthase n=1 Tax=Cohaesibacter sp. ES.047 TaxID=1798205 RepID=UPI000BB9702F|nr:uroporphyrinogen-III synthase [Cohaesibacter sp. ES.047]SNY90568.1 uroporphyrinogen-III synthase [Cohaesibacter sp. ES.047]
MRATLKKRILVTRPEADQAQTVSALGTIGLEAVSAPVMDIESLPFVLPDEPWQAVIVTSRNALRMLSAEEINEIKACRLCCVGAKTADLARSLGFLRIDQPAPHVADLGERLKSSLEVGGGPVLYPAGHYRSGSLAEDLEELDLRVCLIEIYRMVARSGLPDKAIAAIKAGDLAGILVYSTRSAEILARLLEADGLRDKLGRVPFFCLSESVAARLQGSGFVTHVSEMPNEAALLACVKKHHN